MNADDLSGYSARFVRFVRMPLHAEAYRSAYLDQSISSRNELERLRREYETLPPHHAGWCPGECPSEAAALRRGDQGWPCTECRRLRRDVQFSDLGVAESKRTGRPEPPMPNVLMLDLERALMVLGERESAHNVARWLSEGEL